MHLKRFKDIIALKTSGNSGPNGTEIIAFHARNLEVASMSAEAFEAMHDTHVNEAIPHDSLSQNSEATSELASWETENNPEVKSGHLDFGIKTLTINVTQICNLKCNFCAAGGDGTYGEPINRISVEKTLPQLKFFISQIPSGRKFNISFVGGEPLLYPEGILALSQYVTEECKSKNIQPQFTITTNGTLVTPTVIEILKQIKTHITISIDGDKEINDQVRPSKDGKSSTDAALAGLQKLLQLKESHPENLLSLGLSAVITKSNHDILSIYSFFRKFPVDWFEFNFSVFEKDPETQRIYIEQMQQIAALAWQSGQEAELRRIRTFSTYFDNLDSQRRIENFCGAGKTYLMVDAKNRLYTCPWVVGEKDEQVGQNDQLLSDRLAKYQKPLVELNNCNNCWARYICGGGCMFINRTHNGSKHAKDKMFCERTRSLILTAIMYYKWARA